jgi:hypothetical protein
LNSLGGRVAEGYLIHQLIRERKLISYTASDCVSACTIAFLGGAERLLATRARLGFHSLSFGGVDQKHAPEINAELRRTLLDHGAPAWFVEKALGTSAESMWYPTHNELISAKIVTRIVDPDQFAISGIRNWRDQEAMERELLAVPLYAVVRDHDPEAFKKVADRFSEGVRFGRSVLEINREIQAIFAAEILPRYLQTGPDGALQRYWRSQLAEMESLRKKDPALCLAYLFPELRDSSFNLTQLVPEALVKEDIAALTELVQQTVRSPHIDQVANVDEELEGVVARISPKMPRAQEILSEPLKYANEPDAVCLAMLAFYSDILMLPTARSGVILRNLMQK